MSTGDIWQQLEYIESRAAADEDVFDEARTVGRTLARSGNATAIAMGKLAGLLIYTKKRQYGGKTMQRFADETGFIYKTLYKWAKIVHFWTPETLIDNLLCVEPVLTLSHFEQAARTGAISVAEKIIDGWKSNTPSVKEATREIQILLKAPGKPSLLIDGVVCIERVDFNAGTVLLNVGDWVEKLEGYEGKRVDLLMRATEMKA